jgi:hypothetical protein
MWFSRGRNTPPLVTSSNPALVTQADAGVLGLSTTEVLYGNDPIGTDIRSGGRLTFSHLFADGITYADIRAWGVEDSSETFFITSANRPIIARPLTQFGLGVPGGVPAAFLVAFPGLTDPGQIRITSKNDLFGGDALLRRNLWDDGYGSLDILGGYQFARLDDSITINSVSTSLGPPVDQVNITDRFGTQNEFHGASIGVLGRSYRGAIALEALAKIALGGIRQQVDINGTRTIGGITSDGGLFALGTNSGVRNRNQVAFIPELNVNILYEIDDAWRLIGGYSFIYFNNVVLAGNQIDTNLNLTQLPPGPLTGGAVPVARFDRTDFWVQGISLGAEYRW